MERRRILDDISNSSLMQIIPCFKPVFKDYEKGETILTYEAVIPKHIAVVITGGAKLEMLNENGEEFFLESYRPGDIFGELFSLPLDNFAYIVTAETDCKVMYVDYDHVITPCQEGCAHHSQLISNLFMMTAQKSQELALRLSIMNQPSIRSKLMTYLKHIRSISEEEEFTIPISLSQLADYIRVDRASMMRELKSMKDDGLIQGKARHFTILH